MKVLLVISELNYIPSNCYDFLNNIFQTNQEDIAGILILQNASVTFLPKILGLYALGCRAFPNTLLRNLLTLSLCKRENLCKTFNTPVLKAKHVNDPEVVKWIKAHGIDLVINMRTRDIYKKEILSLPTYGCINIHHGILPKYRGLYCDLYALYEGRPAGFSIHKMTDKLDDGNIIYKKAVSESGEKNYIKYLSSLATFEADAINSLIDEIKRYGRLQKGILNEDPEPVYTKTPNKEQIQDMIRAGVII